MLKIYFTTLENMLKNLHFRFMQFVTNSTGKGFLESNKKQQQQQQNTLRKWKVSLAHARS